MANQVFATLSQQSPAELEASLVAVERELQQLRFKLAMRELDDTSQFKKLRHRRAQLWTLVKNLNRAVAKPKSAAQVSALAGETSKASPSSETASDVSSSSSDASAQTVTKRATKKTPKPDQD